MGSLHHNRVTLYAVLFLFSATFWQFAGRIARWGNADIEDYKRFPSREIRNAQPTFYFKDSTGAGLVEAAVPTVTYTYRNKTQSAALEEFLVDTGTTAFIVIKDDAILYEKYFNNYTRDSINTSFSVAKSFISAMIGIAVSEGKIKSIEEPITNYIPEFRSRPGFEKITIRHLMMMSSGLKYVDKMGLDGAMTYYYPDLRKSALSARVVEDPGVHFLYNNYNPLILGLILERATGLPPARYLEEKIWKPLGMEFPASWSLDSEESGFEKMESGLNAHAIDFAKFGRLYLHHGNWNGVQVIPQKWVKESTTRDPGLEGKEYYHTKNWPQPGPNFYYKFFWWGYSDRDKYEFCALGNFGQYIYIVPSKDLIIVRCGRKFGKIDSWPTLLHELACVL